MNVYWSIGSLALVLWVLIYPDARKIQLQRWEMAVRDGVFPVMAIASLVVIALLGW